MNYTFKSFINLVNTFSMLIGCWVLQEFGGDELLKSVSASAYDYFDWVSNVGVDWLIGVI